MQPSVAILGGGVPALSAAHELCRAPLGFASRNANPGLRQKAHSIPLAQPGLGGRADPLAAPRIALFAGILPRRYRHDVGGHLTAPTGFDNLIHRQPHSWVIRKRIGNEPVTLIARVARRKRLPKGVIILRRPDGAPASRRRHFPQSREGSRSQTATGTRRFLSHRSSRT